MNFIPIRSTFISSSAYRELGGRPCVRLWRVGAVAEAPCAEKTEA